jgi:hypothetical protein
MRPGGRCAADARLGVADQFVVLDNKKPAIVEANAALTRRFQNEALPGIG